MVQALICFELPGRQFEYLSQLKGKNISFNQETFKNGTRNPPIMHMYSSHILQTLLVPLFEMGHEVS